MPPHKRSGPKDGAAEFGQKKRKNGRQQLRTVTRTARRDAPVEEAAEDDLELENEAPEEAAPQPAFDDGKAYDALLTLLKADHKEAPKRLNRLKKASEESEDEDIAGFNIEEEENDEDEDAEDEDAEGEDEEDADSEESAFKDPFEMHFNHISETFVELKAADTGKWAFTDRQSFPELSYTSTFQSPPGEQLEKPNLPKTSDLGEYKNIKQRVGQAYLEKHPDPLGSMDKVLLDHMLSYQDINFPYRDYKNQSYKKLYIMHILNHVFKTRDRVLKNNEKIKHYNDALKNGSLKPGAQEPELRDQGFTRPKVLVLLPTRNAAWEVIEQMIKMSGSDQQENRKKLRLQFFEAGGPPDSKPDDFKHMFQGNLNDFFSIGLKFTRKALKLYSSFYTSDVLVASPIGLSMILEDPKQSKRQSDFLSSIEIMVVDHANQIEMQNWDHVGTVMKYMNRIPKEFHGADFSRIRMWAINDHARLLRQTLVFSEFLTPSVNSLVSKSQNVAGKVRFRPVITSQTCIMNSIGLKIKQIFQRFEASDPQSTYEVRFKFFINSVLPSITRQTSYEDGLLIYIPSYFDYVRIKNHMKSNTKITFGSIDEYSSQSKVSKARNAFLSGKTKMLLYTERMHHFRRFELAGVKNVLIYEPPANPLFYKELLRFVGKSIFKSEADVDLSFVKTIFSKWDAAALERIVGNERSPVLCNSVNEMYEFR